MHVLTLSPLVPSATGSGGQRRLFHLLAAVTGSGGAVTVCCPVPEDQRAAVAAAGAAGIVVTGPVRPASRVRETLATVARRPGVLRGLPAQPLASWQLDVLGDGLRGAINAGLWERPDVALVVWDLAAHWKRRLPPALPAVVDLHDASWAYMAGRAETATGARARAAALEAARLRRHAARWLPRYDAVVCVSAQDAERTTALTGAPADVVPNGVDLSALTPVPGLDGPPQVLFTGTMNYPPNAQGAEWLVREVWPAVRAGHGDARLRIAGRNPPEAVRALGAEPGVEVLGEVADMRPFFEAAHVVAVPILAGGGTRLKVLEAGAAGRAMVTTRQGVEGIPLQDGRDVRVEDDPGRFAAAIGELLAAPGQRRELARNARAVIEAGYGWPAVGERFAAVLERASSARTSAQ